MAFFFFQNFHYFLILLSLLDDKGCKASYFFFIENFNGIKENSKTSVYISGTAQNAIKITSLSRDVRFSWWEISSVLFFFKKIQIIVVQSFENCWRTFDKNLHSFGSSLIYFWVEDEFAVLGFPFLRIHYDLRCDVWLNQVVRPNNTCNTTWLLWDICSLVLAIFSTSLLLLVLLPSKS